MLCSHNTKFNSKFIPEVPTDIILYLRTKFRYMLTDLKG